MRTNHRRPWLLVGLCVMSVPLVASALAHACTGLATVSVNPGAVASGGSVTVSGRYFTAHDPSDARSELAKIRVDQVDGPVIAEAAPTGGSRAFSVNVRLPQLSPGTHVLIVTQNTTSGTPSYGTPARQAFTVTAPAARSGATAGGQAMPDVTGAEPAVLTLSTARRLARKRIKSAHRSAKGISARCARRSATSAVCRTKWKVGSRSFQKRVVVTMAQSSRLGW